MPVYDYVCEHCGKTTESVRGYNVTRIHCECGKTAKRVISMSGVHCGNEDDTTWAKDAREVMPKDSKDPYVNDFMRNPTKRNLKRAMKSQGIRHMEPGEKAINRQKFNLERHGERVMRKFQERNRVEINGR